MVDDAFLPVNGGSCFCFYLHLPVAHVQRHYSIYSLNPGRYTHGCIVKVIETYDSALLHESARRRCTNRSTNLPSEIKS